MEEDNVLAETLVNYNMLIEMIPAMEDVVDTGMVSMDAAIAVFNELSPVKQEEFVYGLDAVKKMQQKYDSRIREMENDIAAKTVVESPSDYIPVRKQNKDLESKNDFLEARLRKLDEEDKLNNESLSSLGQLRWQIMELQQKLDPVQEHQQKVHEDIQLFNGKTAVYIAETGKFGYLKDEIQNASADEVEEYRRTVQTVKDWIAGIEKVNMEIVM